ncbi:MAG: hypothetical protein AAF614_29340 [Chloroflexota bacterium]
MAVLFLLPFLLAVWWGAFLVEGAYPTLRYAHNLALGRGLAFDMGLGSNPAPLFSSLQTAVLTLLAWFGLPLETAVSLLTTLGWSVAATAIYQLGHTLNRQTTGLVAAILLTLSPLFATTHGLPASWLIAWIVLALIMVSRKRPFSLTLFLALILLTHFDAATIMLVLLIWLLAPRNARSMPKASEPELAEGGPMHDASLDKISPQSINRHIWLLPGFILLVVSGTWAIWASSQLGNPFFRSTLIALKPGTLPTVLQQLWSESGLYWLFIPFLFAGLFSGWESGGTNASLFSKQRIIWLTAGWLIWASLVGSETAGWLATVVALLLVGECVDVIVSRIVDSQGEEGVPAKIGILGYGLLEIGWVLGAVFVLLLPQVASLQERKLHRPIAQQRIEAQVASWLQQNSPAEATVWATPRLAFLADRPLLGERLPASPAALPTLLGDLDQATPHYIVSSQGVNWPFLTATGWFQTRYSRALRFTTSTAEAMVWAYEESLFDVGVERPLTTQTPNGINLISAQVAPQRIQPGDQLFVTLELQATQPVSNTFQTVVRVISPLDGIGWGQQVDIRPQSRPLDWWEPGQTISERIVLTTTADIPVGVYELNVSFLDENETTFWTLTDGENEMEAVGLGITAVPWQGDISAPPVDATFGDQIKLAAAVVKGNITAGETISVNLYWEAVRIPDADYTVFVHLVDGNNELVTSHDGQPHNGRFPTSHWLPGEMLLDSHPLALPPDLPPDSYQIKAGLYLLETGERLPVWDNAGNEQPERSIALPDQNANNE